MHLLLKSLYCLLSRAGRKCGRPWSKVLKIQSWPNSPDLLHDDISYLISHDKTPATTPLTIIVGQHLSLHWYIVLCFILCGVMLVACHWIPSTVFYRERGRHTNLYIRGLPRALNEVSGFIMGWLIVLQMPRSSFNNASLVGASRPVLSSWKINRKMRMVVVIPWCQCMWCHFLSMVYQMYNRRLGYNVALFLLYHKPTGMLCIVSAQSYLHLVSY